MGGSAPKYDWEEIRRKYVTGDDSVTLEALSKPQNAPSFDTLRRRSGREAWTKQRENFRLQKATIVATDPAAVQAAEQVSKLVDIAEMTTRLSKFGRDLNATAQEWLKNCEPTKLRPSDVVAIAKLGVEIERLCAGLATEHQEVTSGGKPINTVKVEFIDAKKS